MKTFVHKHMHALQLAVVAGLICVAPSILATAALGQSYKGIAYMPLNNEETYITRIQEVLDGHPMVTAPFFYEYKDSPVVVVPLNEWLYAIPAFVIGVPAVFFASKFLLPAALFFLVYIFVRKLLGERNDALVISSALAAASLVTLGSAFVDYRSIITLIVHGGVPGPQLWTRPVNPIIGALQIFGLLTLLMQVWERTWRYAYIAAGIVLATTIGYFFTLGISLALVGTLGLFALVRKDFAVLRELILAAGISIILDAWFWYAMFASLGSSGGSALALRNGLSYTHAPVLNLALFAATTVAFALFCYSYMWKKDREYTSRWIFIAALLCASWVSFNQQVITGREIWYYHFAQYTVPLAMVSVVCAAYFALRSRAPRALYVGMISLSLVTIAYGCFSVASFVPLLSQFSADQKYGSVMTWLNMNAPHDCVVLVANDDEWFERLIPTFTSCNVYSTVMTYAGVPEDRIVHNFLLNMELSGVRPAEADAYLKSHEQHVRDYFYRNWDEAFGHGEEPWVLERITSLEKQYAIFSKTSLEENIKKYRVDYFVSEGPLASSLANQLPHLGLVATAGEFRVYSFR